MRRKTYAEPTMQVVQLKQKPTLLAGSEQVNATMSTEWEETDI